MEERAKNCVRSLLAVVSMLMILAVFPQEASATIDLSGGDIPDPATWTKVKEFFDKGQSDIWVPVYGIEADTDETALVCKPGTETRLHLIGQVSRGLKEPKDDGYAIRVEGTLLVVGGNNTSRVTGGNSTGKGGGFYVADGGYLAIDKNVFVSGNKANKGGGIYVAAGGTLELLGDVKDNTAVYGGGIYVEEGGHVFQAGTSSNVANNKAESGSALEGLGGGVYSCGVYELECQKIASNKANQGGGIYVAGSVSKLIMTGGEISKNTSEYDGGGVFVRSGGSVEVKAGIIQDNKATRDGGGIYSCDGGNAHLSGGTVKDNECGGIGGGVSASQTGEKYGVSISGEPTVKNNKGGSGAKDDINIENKDISIEGYVSDNAEIGLSMLDERAKETFTIGALGSVSPAVFKMNDSNYTAVTDSNSGEIMRAPKDTVTHKVTFSVPGSSVKAADQYVIDGGYAVAPDLKYKGQVPAGWITPDGDTWDFDNDQVTEDLSLEIEGWVDSGEKYTIRYVTGIEGLSFEDREVEASLGKYLQPEGYEYEGVVREFKNKGADFRGWCLDENLQTEYEGQVVADLAKYASDDNVICFYAKTAHVHKNKDGMVEFEPWASKNSLPSNAGNYYLLYDVTLDGSQTAWKPSKEVHLCLNGHKIERASGPVNDSVIIVDNKAQFYLYDEPGNEGQITGGYVPEHRGGGVRVADGLFSMYGGTITGNTAKDGGGVAIGYNHTFEMHGGVITGNTVPENGIGGGVWVDHSELLTLMFDSIFRVSSFEGSVITIKDNKAGEAESDVQLPSKGEARNIKIDGDIADGSSIGITMAPPQAAVDGDIYYFTSGLGDNPLNVFFVDAVAEDAGYDLHLGQNLSGGNKEAYLIVDKGGGGEHDLNVSPIKVTKTIVVKYKKVRKNKQTISRKKLMTVKDAEGTVTYKKVSVNKSSKKFSVNKKTGALTIKKGTKKGLYKVRIKVTAGNGSKNVTVRIRVK